jgi:hypothetical protein
MEQLLINNANPTVKSSDFAIKASLVGDMKPASEPPSFGNKILLIPTSPEDHTIV